MARPEIKRTPIPDGETIAVRAGSMAQARDVLEGVKRKYPKVDVEAALAGAEIQRSYAKGVVRIDLNFGGPLSGRSLVKSALALAHETGLPIVQCRDALAYLREADAQPCFGYYYVDDPVGGRPPAMPLHCVAIDANPETGLILGYVEYFGIHRAVVCLGRDHVGDRLKAVYALDPRTAETVEVAVRLDFDVADVQAIFDYERDDAEKRQEAFGAVFGPVLGSHHAAERDRVGGGLNVEDVVSRAGSSAAVDRGGGGVAEQVERVITAIAVDGDRQLTRVADRCRAEELDRRG